MTFNMQFGQRWDAVEPNKAPINLQDTIDFLKSHPHDIILLQEVEQARPGGEQIQPPPNFTRLQNALEGYHGVFAYPRINPDELPFGIALAVFSRSPISEFSACELPPANVKFHFDGKPKMPSHRQLLRARTVIHGHSLQIFNTHLQAFFMIDATSNDHREQRDLVEQSIRRATGPAILGGDFNCSPEEKVVEQFAEAGFQTAQTDSVTWRLRPYVTDHLFFNNGLRLIEAKVIDTDCSDHRPVSASFDFCD